MSFCAGKSNMGTRSGICPSRAERNLSLPSNACRAFEVALHSLRRSTRFLRETARHCPHRSDSRQFAAPEAQVTKRKVQEDRPVLHSITDKWCDAARIESHSASSNSLLLQLPFVVDVSGHCLTSLVEIPFPDTFEDGSMLHQCSLLIA